MRQQKKGLCGFGLRGADVGLGNSGSAEDGGSGQVRSVGLGGFGGLSGGSSRAGHVAFNSDSGAGALELTGCSDGCNSCIRKLKYTDKNNTELTVGGFLPSGDQHTAGGCSSHRHGLRVDKTRVSRRVLILSKKKKKGRNMWKRSDDWGPRKPYKMSAPSSFRPPS